MAQQSITKMKFSASTDGIGVLIAATGTVGTTVHTAHATELDEIWLQLYNGHTAAVVTTVEWGQAANPIIVTVPAKVHMEVAIPGNILTGSKLLTIFAATTNVIVAHGFVNRLA